MLSFTGVARLRFNKGPLCYFFELQKFEPLKLHEVFGTTAGLVRKFCRFTNMNGLLVLATFYRFSSGFPSVYRLCSVLGDVLSTIYRKKHENVFFSIRFFFVENQYFVSN